MATDYKIVVVPDMGALDHASSGRVPPVSGTTTSI